MWAIGLNFWRYDRLSAWSSVKLRECCSEVEKEDDERKSIAQQNLHKSTDFLTLSATAGVLHVAASTTGGNQNRILVIQYSKESGEANVIRAHARSATWTKRVKDDGRAAKVRHDGHPRGGKDWRLGNDTGIASSGEAQFHYGLP